MTILNVDAGFIMLQNEMLSGISIGNSDFALKIRPEDSSQDILR